MTRRIIPLFGIENFVISPPFTQPVYTISPPTGYKWTVSQITVQDVTNPSPPITCQVYLNTNLICESPDANSDVASDDPPIIVHDTDTLNIGFKPVHLTNRPTALVIAEEEPI